MFCTSFVAWSASCKHPSGPRAAWAPPLLEGLNPRLRVEAAPPPARRSPRRGAGLHPRRAGGPGRAGDGRRARRPRSGAAASAGSGLAVEAGRRALGQAHVEHDGAAGGRVGQHAASPPPTSPPPCGARRTAASGPCASRPARRPGPCRRGRAEAAAPGGTAEHQHEALLRRLPAEPSLGRDRVDLHRRKRLRACCAAGASRRSRPRRGGRRRTRSAATGRCSRTLISSVFGRSADDRHRLHRGEARPPPAPARWAS